MSDCPEGKIRNPNTGRCISATGALARRLGLSANSQEREEVNVVVYNIDYAGVDGQIIVDDDNTEKLRQNVRRLGASRVVSQSGTSGFHVIYEVPKDSIPQFKSVIKQHYRGLGLESRPKFAFPSKRMVERNSFGANVSIDEL